MTTFSATRHISWALNAPKMLIRKRILVYLRPRERV